MAQKISLPGNTDNTKRDALEVPLEDVKTEWKMLWQNRIDDKVRAEGIAKKDYSLLFVDQGTVISATRDFKPLDLKDILKSYISSDSQFFDSPHPSVGGYGKFARTIINKQKRFRQWKTNENTKNKKNKKKLQQKKGGKGWLHFQMKK